MKKNQDKKKIDVEAKLFMFILQLKEEKQKEYSFIECEKNIAYIFDNYDEFKSYFLQNGVSNISCKLLELCRIKTTKKGTIIALKGLCDHTIKKYKMRKELTQTQINEIHARGKITQAEKVQEWESYGVCAPGDTIGSTADRCHAFSNCHDCLIEYVSSHGENDKLELKPVNIEEFYSTELKALKKIRK